MLITSTAAALLAHRAKLMGGTMVTFSWEDNPAGLSTRISLVNKALTQHYIAAYNAWLLIFPSDLCADRSRNLPWCRNEIFSSLLSTCRSGPSIPMLSPTDERNLLTLAVYVGLLAVLFRAIPTKPVDGESKPAFSDSKVRISEASGLVP
jgi:hypothetical protein